MYQISLAVAAFIVIGSGASALADGIPDELIQAQHQSCVESCTQSSGGQSEACETACSCTDREIQKNFTLDEYMAMSDAVKANPDTPAFTPETQAKISQVFKTCTGS
jgi:hypothetical protein